MKRILSIALSLLLLVNIIPTNSFVRAEGVNTEANVVAAAEVKEYTNSEDSGDSRDVGTKNNPIVMYVGDSVKLTSAITNQGWLMNVSTRWTHEEISGTNVASYDTNRLEDAKSQTTMATATAVGNIRIKLEWKNRLLSWRDTSETSSYFYITVIDKPQLAGINQPNQMLFTKDAEWFKYNEGIAKITLNAKNIEEIQGSDVIIIMDKSSSMREKSRWTTQKTAVTNITTDLLDSANKNNRVAVVAFAGDVGGSFNFKANQQDAINKITAISLKTNNNANGTNYSLALQQAINFANSRENSNRPLHVIFMTDGEYTGKNSGQAQYQALNGVAVTMKAMGIELNKAGRDNLSTLFGATNYTDTKASTIATDITNVMALIAEKHNAASEAVITDTIAANYTAIIGNSLYPASAGVQLPASGNDVTVNIGAMASNDDYSYSYFVKINEANRNTDNIDYATSTNTILNYKVATDSKSVSAVIPKLTTKTGSIVVNYVLGSSIVGTNTEANLSIRNEAYSVTPVAPRGYKLVSVDSVLRTLTYDNNHETIDFPVTKLKELHVSYLGMQGLDPVPVVDKGIYFKGEKATVLGSDTITQIIDGKNYYLAGWTAKKALTTDKRVLINTKEQFSKFKFVKFGKEIPVNNNRTLYAVWAPENINSTFKVDFINEGAAYQPTGFDFDHVYSYGENLKKPADPSKEQTVPSTFEFLGWTSGEIDEEGQPIIVDLNTFMITGDLKLTAVYKAVPRNYQVKFLNSDGIIISDESKEYDSKIINKTVPTIPASEEKVGYDSEFAGWEIQGTEIIVDLTNDETPVLVKGPVTYQATYKETARTNMSFIIRFVDGNGNVLAPEYLQNEATFDQTYEITNAMLPTTLTAFVPRTANPRNIKITDVEENIVTLVYDAVVVPVTPVVIPTPQTPQAQTPVVTPVTPTVRPVVIPTPQTPQAQTPVVTPEEIVTPEVVVTPEIVTPETPKADKPSVDIKDEVTPKAESPLSWAFMNLLMMILTACASIVLLMAQLVGKKRNTSKTAFIRFFSLLPALVSIIAFFVTESMMNPMIMFDKWTLMMVLIAAVQVVVVALSLKKFDVVEENIER